MGEQQTTETTEDNTEVVEEKKPLADVLYPNKDEKATDEKPEETEEVVDEKVEEKTEEVEADAITYEDFTLPEGMEEISPDAIELFKGLEMSQENAQKLVDYGTQMQLDTVKTIQDAQEAQQKEWADTVDKDLKAELPKAIDFVKKHSDEGFNKFLNESGLGNHPEMVKMMAKLSDFAGEDFMGKEKPVAGDPVPKTLAEKMYPNQ